jgi:non-ribosomal peptide synthetase component F
LTVLPLLGPEIRNLDEVLARRAARAPDALAFAADGERLTYGGLLAAVEALAGAAARQGIGPGDRIALFIPAGLGFVRAFFALQRLAAVPCAFSPYLPAATAARSAARVRPRFVLAAGPAARELAEACTAVGLRAIDLAALVEVPAVPAALSPAPAEPDDPAFLQPTSGTSGEPRSPAARRRGPSARSTAGSPQRRAHAGDETADGERYSVEQLDRRRDREPPRTVEQQLDQRDRVEPRAARPQPQLVGQLSGAAGKRRAAAHEIAHLVLEIHPGIHRRVV